MEKMSPDKPVSSEKITACESIFTKEYEDRKKLSEKQIEQTLSIQVKRRGGIAFKFVSPGMAGVPDRLVLMPNKHAAFVELKAPGKKMRALQLKRQRQIEALGFKVFCVDSLGQIEPVLDEIEGS